MKPMSVLINVYCTLTKLPNLTFPHKLIGNRSINDPELQSHLKGFIGYVLQFKPKEMSQAIYYTIKHIENVKNHISIEINEDDIEMFCNWVKLANGICFLPDGTIKNPSWDTIIPQEIDSDRPIYPPYPEGSFIRKKRTESLLLTEGIDIPKSLPPVLDETELSLREPSECASRVLGLFLVALRAESVSSNEEIPISELKQRLKSFFNYLTKNEKSFIENNDPLRQEVIDFVWKYECINILLWSIGLVSELLKPINIVDVSSLAQIILSLKPDQFIRNAKYRPTNEILDELDYYYRLQWLSHETCDKGMPNGLNAGVIQERLYALNWVTRFYNAEWDDIDTPA